MVRRILFQYCFGLIFSAFGFLLFAGIYRLLEMVKLEIGFWGDKTGPLSSLFLGLSIGGTFGVLLIERLVYKLQGWNVLSIIFAILLGSLGTFLGVIIMLDRMGGGDLFYLCLF